MRGAWGVRALLVAAYVALIVVTTTIAVDNARETASSIVWARGFEAPVGDPDSKGDYPTVRRFCESGGSRGFHLGDDIDVVDAPVRAAANGRVVYAGFRRGWDGVVLVEHRPIGEPTVYTLYGHLQDVAVHEGDDVVAGGSIGVSGPPGNGPIVKHLHFEVKTLPTLGSGWSPHTPCPPSGYLDPAEYLRTHAVP